MENAIFTIFLSQHPRNDATPPEKLEKVYAISSAIDFLRFIKGQKRSTGTDRKVAIRKEKTKNFKDEQIDTADWSSFDQNNHINRISKGATHGP